MTPRDLLNKNVIKNFIFQFFQLSFNALTALLQTWLHGFRAGLLKLALSPVVYPMSGPSIFVKCQLFPRSFQILRKFLVTNP